MNLVKLSNLGLGFKPDSNERKINIAVDNQTVKFNEQGELSSITPPPKKSAN